MAMYMLRKGESFGTSFQFSDLGISQHKFQLRT
jgi:hypothetical protein